MFGNKNGNRNAQYSQVSLDDFSDESSNDDGGRYPSRINGSGGSGGMSAEDSLQRQQQLFKEQDQGLELLGQSAERLGEMSMVIHDELGKQNQLLDEMDEDLEEANANLDLVTKTTKDFIEKAGGTKECILIVSLSLVALLLLLLILYT